MRADAVSTSLSPAEIEAVQRLLAAAEEADGFRPVSDQFWADLVHPGARRLAATRIVASSNGELVAYAQASSPLAQPDPADAIWAVEIVVHPQHRHDLDRLCTELLKVIAEATRADGGQILTWIVQGPSDEHRHAADTAGFVATRHLHQMRRPLPADFEFAVTTRPFDADRDVDDWLRVNSRAFAWNPEQGTWTESDLRARMDEEWFDPTGFLIHDREGRMAGFCWTKIHAGTDPRLGEIYVIAVDPDFHGLGLGRSLTLAGLASLSDRDVRMGMLFVDSDNVAAVALYDKLGFEITRTDSMFEKRLTT